MSDSSYSEGDNLPTMRDRLDQISAIILTGGASLRMGRAKWSLPWPRPREIELPISTSWTMLNEILFKLKKVAQNIVVVCSPLQQQEIEHCIRVCGLWGDEMLITSDTEEYQGPLFGLHQGLKKLKENDIQHEWTFLTSCDAPLINLNITKVLQSEITDSVSAIIPRDENYKYPLCGLYKRDIAWQVAELLRDQQRKLMLLFEHVNTRYVSIEEMREVDPELRSLINLNEPEIYQHWHKKLEQEK